MPTTWTRGRCLRGGRDTGGGCFHSHGSPHEVTPMGDTPASPVTAARPEVMEGAGPGVPLTSEQPLSSWRYSRASENRLWKGAVRGLAPRQAEGEGARPSTHLSPWAVGRPGSGMATQHSAFSRRCSRKSWVTCASGSTGAQRWGQQVHHTPKQGGRGLGAWGHLGCRRSCRWFPWGHP